MKNESNHDPRSSTFQSARLTHIATGAVATGDALIVADSRSVPTGESGSSSSIKGSSPL